MLSITHHSQEQPSTSPRTLRSSAAQLLTARMHRLYCAYVVHPDVSSRRSIALALTVRLITTSRGSTTRRPVASALLRLCHASECAVSSLDFSSVGRTGSLHALGHYISRLTTRHLVASALLHLCRASERAISLLDFLSVGRTSSRRLPSHYVSRLDYSPLGRTGSTEPKSCIQTCRLAARQLDFDRINSLPRQQS
jgi:hypothetical protein